MNPGSMFSDEIFGLVLIGTTGSANDLTFMTPDGVPVMRNPSATPHLIALGDFTALGALKLPSLGAGFLRSDAMGVLSPVSTVNLNAAEVSGTLPLALGGTGQSTALAALNALLPAQAGNAGMVLVTDGTAASWQAAGGYSLTLNSAQFNPTDSATFYFGVFASLAMTTTAGIRRQYVNKAGRIRACALNWFANGNAGSSEPLSIYIRVNNTTDHLVATISDGNAQKLFLNTALNIPVTAGDYIEGKVITPAWSPNPTQVNIGGTVFVE